MYENPLCSCPQARLYICLTDTLTGANLPWEGIQHQPMDIILQKLEVCGGQQQVNNVPAPAFQ